jgi:CBS domain-containing protein
MEERQARMEVALTGVRVGDIMSPQPLTVPSDTTVAELIDRYVLAYRHTAFPLAVADRPVGLVTLDRARQVPIERRAATPVRDVACPPEELTLTTPDEPLTDLLPRLNECADGRALVVVDGRLVGIVTPSDISRAVQRGVLRAQVTNWSG